MKKLIPILCLAALVGCKNNLNEEPVVSSSVEFVIANLQSSMESTAPRRTTTPLGDSQLTELWIFDSDGTQLIHQTSRGSNFGKPTLSLSNGEHTLTFIASGTTSQAVVDGYWQGYSVQDCYCVKMTINVSSSLKTVNVTLTRANYELIVKSTDAVISDAYTLKVTIGNYHNRLHYSLSSGAGVSKYFQTNLTNYMGTTITMSTNSLPTEVDIEENIDVTIEVMDAGNKVLKKIETQAPVKSNHKTTISGELFYMGAAAPIKVTTDWAEPYAVTL